MLRRRSGSETGGSWKVLGLGSVGGESSGGKEKGGERTEWGGVLLVLFGGNFARFSASGGGEGWGGRVEAGGGEPEG